MNASLVLTEYWLKSIVVALDLCPFARYPYEQGLIRINLCDEPFEADWLNFFFDELEYINAETSDSLSTTLMVLTNGPVIFDEFNDLVGDLESMLEESGLDSVFQLVIFHPQFRFEGTQVDDVDNYVNRSPFPIIQILRSSELNALKLSPERAEEISRLNSAKLNSLSTDELSKLFYYLKK